ncbi:glutamate racemase [Methylophilaceae bacterium]|nr:glutamate racemase [Methylophilaceae bacterium]
MTDVTTKPQTDATPIGVFDSGVGGLSVLKHIRQLLPHEDLLFCADCDHAPYGNKSPEFIRERALHLSGFLIAEGAKALVVACNTATAAAIEALRQHYPLPIIGMEPAVKPAAAATRTGVIGVLATSGTLQSAQFAGLLESYGQNVRVVTQACIGLVECIERGELEADSTRQLVSQYLQPLLDAGADTIVLGCTHYPFVRHLIAAQAGAGVTLIDTGEAVARQVQKRLAESGLLNATNAAPRNTFWVNRQSGDAFLETAEVITGLWGGKADLQPLPNPVKYRARLLSQ